MMRLEILIFGALQRDTSQEKKKPPTQWLCAKVNKLEIKADFKEMQSPKLYGLASQKASPTDGLMSLGLGCICPKLKRPGAVRYFPRAKLMHLVQWNPIRPGNKLLCSTEKCSRYLDIHPEKHSSVKDPLDHPDVFQLCTGKAQFSPLPLDLMCLWLPVCRTLLSEQSQLTFERNNVDFLASELPVTRFQKHLNVFSVFGVHREQ